MPRIWKCMQIYYHGEELLVTFVPSSVSFILRGRRFLDVASEENLRPSNQHPCFIWAADV